MHRLEKIRWHFFGRLKHLQTNTIFFFFCYARNLMRKWPNKINFFSAVKQILAVDVGIINIYNLHRYYWSNTTRQAVKKKKIGTTASYTWEIGDKKINCVWFDRPFRKTVVKADIPADAYKRYHFFIFFFFRVTLRSFFFFFYTPGNDFFE